MCLPHLLHDDLRASIAFDCDRDSPEDATEVTAEAMPPVSEPPAIAEEVLCHG
jgi:hypothetical protein